MVMIKNIPNDLGIISMAGEMHHYCESVPDAVRAAAPAAVDAAPGD